MKAFTMMFTALYAMFSTVNNLAMAAEEVSSVAHETALNFSTEEKHKASLRKIEIKAEIEAALKLAKLPAPAPKATEQAVEL